MCTPCVLFHWLVSIDKACTCVCVFCVTLFHCLVNIDKNVRVCVLCVTLFHCLVDIDKNLRMCSLCVAVCPVSVGCSSVLIVLIGFVLLVPAKKIRRKWPTVP